MRTFNITSIDTAGQPSTLTHQADYAKVDDHGNLCGHTTVAANTPSWLYAAGRWFSCVEAPADKVAP